jgi:hypothetical protein
MKSNFQVWSGVQLLGSGGLIWREVHAMALHNFQKFVLRFPLNADKLAVIVYAHH